MNYKEIDNSAQCSDDVTGKRTVKPSGLLVHTTDGSNSLAWLLGGSGEASADYLIDRDGTRHKIVPDGEYAYHAGNVSPLAPGGGQPMTNEYFIGVELEARTSQLVTFQQIDSLAELLAYRLSPKYAWRFPFVIYAHSGIARPVGRRADPYLFDWGAFFGRLYAHCKAAGVPGI